MVRTTKRDIEKCIRASYWGVSNANEVRVFFALHFVLLCCCVLFRDRRFVLQERFNRGLSIGDKVMLFFCTSETNSFHGYATVTGETRASKNFTDCRSECPVTWNAKCALI